MDLSNQEWANLFPLDLTEEKSFRTLRRIARCNRPLYISPDTGANLCELWHILCARKTEGNWAKAPKADQIDSLTASRRAALGHGTLTIGHALGLHESSDHRRALNCTISELDAFWAAVYCIIDRACRRLLRGDWIFPQWEFRRRRPRMMGIILEVISGWIFVDIRLVGAREIRCNRLGVREIRRVGAGL